MPCGLSRRVVRFIEVDDVIYVVKELNGGIARHEFQMLSELNALAGAPKNISSGHFLAPSHKLLRCMSGSISL